jgi:CxC5 like cysteine cluster associated with KDZ transposases/CxC6 like cysteine cluster associated with KDZ transposases
VTGSPVFLCAIYRLISMVQNFHAALGILVLLLFLPLVSASQVNERAFPDIPFKEFSYFIEKNFSSSISLTSVLVILFSVTENTQLLSLHGRQQKKKFQGERSTSATSWIRALARPIRRRLEKSGDYLLDQDDVPTNQDDEQITVAVAMKLDQLAKILDLHPYNNAGKFTGKLKPISHKDIQPVHVICPDAVTCETMACKPRSLPMSTKIRDIPLVTLIKGFAVYDNVQVLAGYCDMCKTTYYADHERTPSSQSGQYDKVYLNSAQYLKIGHSLWVDREFTSAVMSGVYHFHASTAAYTAFWNNVFASESSSGKVSHRQIWQAFVQESVRFMASMSGINLTLPDNLRIDEVTKEAYYVLGEGGLIRAANGHACEECTQKYRRASNQEVDHDQSATVGMDEANVLIGEDHDVEESTAPVKMVVVDGIVMGHSICAYPECTSELANARGGVYCALHENMFGAMCHVANCINVKVEGTLACQIHQGKWNRYLKNRRQRNLNGFKRAIRRSDDSWPWMETNQQNTQPHDEDTDTRRDRDAFVPSRIYCVETICAPCGVVVAWAKFAKAESPTNILQFLDHVYPVDESRPDYICIDKACLVLRSSIANGSWQRWSQTSRFIVDSYHYTNHRATDVLCRTWCNPAPLNGVAPNLVIRGTNNDGDPYQKHAFNTQACEQLNAWLGGFESILKRMTPGNFNWFLHTMLCYHTVHVLKRQKHTQESTEDSDSE